MDTTKYQMKMNKKNNNNNSNNSKTKQKEELHSVNILETHMRRSHVHTTIRRLRKPQWNKTEKTHTEKKRNSSLMTKFLFSAVAAGIAMRLLLLLVCVFFLLLFPLESIPFVVFSLSH